MKTYQFAILAAIGLLIAGALVYKPKKKPCGCGGHAETPPAVIEDEAQG